MMDFYDLIDTYAALNNISKDEALHLWYRGSITAADLLQSDLNNEGIYGYTEHLINVIKVLGDRSIKDGNGNPWTSEKGGTNNGKVFDQKGRQARIHAPGSGDRLQCQQLHGADRMDNR